MFQIIILEQGGNIRDRSERPKLPEFRRSFGNILIKQTISRELIDYRIELFIRTQALVSEKNGMSTNKSRLPRCIPRAKNMVEQGHDAFSGLFEWSHTSERPLRQSLQSKRSILWTCFLPVVVVRLIEILILSVGYGGFDDANKPCALAEEKG